MWKVTVLVLLSCSLFASARGALDLMKDSEDYDSEQTPETCTYDSDCEEFEHMCINGICAVPPKTPELPDTGSISKSIKDAIENTTFGKAMTNVLSKAKVDNCTEDSDCSTANHICLNNVCVPTPISPQTIDNVSKSVKDAVSNFSSTIEKSVGSVLSAAKPEKCSEDSDCSENYICLNDVCVMTPVSTPSFSLGKSLQDKLSPLLIGATCQTDDECKSVANALCLENVCQCSEKYVTSVLSNSCLLKATKEGDPCEIDKQCESVSSTICLKGKCVKPPIPGASLGNKNSGSTTRISELVAAILLIKLCFV